VPALFLEVNIALASPCPIATSLGDDLSVLNDEFDKSATLANWQRINQVEGWNANQLQAININQSAGRHRVEPQQSTGHHHRQHAADSDCG
jgi:hypothetical protein